LHILIRKFPAARSQFSPSYNRRHTAKSFRFGISQRSASGSRFDHADSITNPAAHEMEIDIRLAARACSKFATLRFRVAEIAELALTQAQPPRGETCSTPWLTLSSDTLDRLKAGR
jgi:hypothetical protein